MCIHTIASQISGRVHRQSASGKRISVPATSSSSTGMPNRHVEHEVSKPAVARKRILNHVPDGVSRRIQLGLGELHHAR